MGADIKIEPHSAIVEDVDQLAGQSVCPCAGTALILAALTARSETDISNIAHIERGYFEIGKKLEKLAAKIAWTEDCNLASGDPAEILVGGTRSVHVPAGIVELP